MIGRTLLLNEALENNESEFIAIYGRRRVGKTYLVDEVYGNNIVFRHTGLQPLSQNRSDSEKENALKRQLNAFYDSLKAFGLVASNENKPNNWLDAFSLLAQGLKKFKNQRVVVFIDELPWMDTPKSYFLEAFSHFWNNYCFPSKNIVLVICGSASSWILNNIIHGLGGLYNRTTRQIRLSPFTLLECEKYLISRGIEYSRYDIAQAYMSVGGVPFYLRYFKRGLSLAQNIDQLFFGRDAILKDEFDELFSSQFTHPEKYRKIVEMLGEKNSGFTPNEIAEKIGISNNGDFYKMLKALDAGTFISSYSCFNEAKNEIKYRLIDPFCLFYLKHIKENKDVSQYWQSNIDNQKVVSWKGIAFENLCFNHIDKIKNKIGIPWMATNETFLTAKGKEDQQGAQIDLIIERKDNIVNLCEAKFYSNEYTINKTDHLNLENKKEHIKSMIGKRQSVQKVLLTTYGLKHNEYFYDYEIVITLDDLFID